MVFRGELGPVCQYQYGRLTSRLRNVHLGIWVIPNAIQKVYICKYVQGTIYWNLYIYLSTW